MVYKSASAVVIKYKDKEKAETKSVRKENGKHVLGFASRDVTFDGLEPPCGLGVVGYAQ